MKPTLQKKESIAHAGRLVAGTSKVKKATNRQKRSVQKASEVETTRRLEQVIDPSTKIKLQLFPVDEATRIGLEKDGLNPFLELTLRARKKISSVINHFHTKWGGSNIASIGDPMLLPYQSHLKSNRWTLKDTTITAGDVYTALKSPPIFRLSYGWFCVDDPSRVSGTTASHNCVTSESMQKESKTTEQRKLLDATTQVDDTDHVETKVKMGESHEQSTSPWDDELTNLSIGGLLSEASLQGKLNNNNNNKQQTPFNWDDCSTALSIGGLLSEVSMQAKLTNKSDPKSFISDSFDTSIINPSQLKNDPHVSILDAEETCNAFSFRKFSSSSKNVRVTAKATQDSTSNSFKFPRVVQGDREAEDISGPEPKTELFPRPQQYNEDSTSLGLRGINWNVSLGPFDLGNSMPWKI